MIRNLWSELKRRGVVSAAITYALAVWATLQGVDMLADNVGLPPETWGVVFLTLLAAFPVAMIVAWKYDLTAAGIERAESQEALLEKLRSSPATSVAVLPFRDASAAGDQAYFGDGMAAEITTAFASVPGLGVASLTSAFAMRNVDDVREIAAALEVETVLQGEVSLDGGGISISVNLLDGDSGVTLWTQEYARNAADIIDVQEDIAREVVRHFKEELGPSSPAPRMRTHSPHPEAYELYLQARYFWTRRHEVGLDKSIECYEDAIRIDPEYALAYAGLADVYMFKGFYLIEEPDTAFAHARRTIDRALRSGPKQAETHRAQGMMRTWYEWNFTEAEASFRKALELDSTDPITPLMFGQLLAATGRRDEARAMAERGRRLDPTSPGAVGLTAVTHAINRDGDRASELTEAVLKRDGVSFINRYIAGTAHLGAGRYAKAIEHLEFAVDLSRRNPLIVTFLAQAFARDGQTEHARALLDSLSAGSAASYPYGGRAIVRAVLGEMDGVESDMDRAIERREPYLFIAGSAPLFDPLRAHPRYPEWIERIGLPLLEVGA